LIIFFLGAAAAGSAYLIVQPLVPSLLNLTITGSSRSLPSQRIQRRSWNKSGVTMGISRRWI